MRRLLVLLLTLVLAAVLGGCGLDFRDQGPAAAKDTDVSVSGSSDDRPTLAYRSPVKASEPWSRTVLVGTGDRLADGGDVLLNMYAEDGRTHAVVQDTYGGSPRMLRMDPADLGRRLYDALQGQRAGARVLLVSDEDDRAEGDRIPLVLVVDVLPVTASGDDVAPGPGVPKVTVPPGRAPKVTVPAADPPDDLVVRTLVRGDGRQVEPGSTITVRYVGVRWKDGKVVDSNWDTGSVFTTVFGLGTMVDAWEQGLLEQSVGSRVMIVAPPSAAYGGTDSPLADDTLVYVVDILDTHTTPHDDDTGDGAAPEPQETQK
ncbi:FKBP-type peptidyl-prolyl cis-trans isomerase [Cellulomonas sp. PhB143]|uniref:FKBP-type peptidyl-prolyl cis-trans isomerase n=1 Tax=Cellulomonas sp. PhB143 TaxID=2485186 RepID=UPI000F4780A9|nr:FKBP-type peptidyl-prolyl cis-trans isomerase [Cellulomonas sp. PhB143]ROS74381.1 peptidylprolyl isomerase [Cellulomonas sp. PhB143]